MLARLLLLLAMTTASVVVSLLAPAPVPACCPAPPGGKRVVNADQTVIIIWDSATQTEHFIRQASFKSEADDFGFLVPTPNQPELNESGNDAFPYLEKLTEPETSIRPQIVPTCCCWMIGCSGGVAHLPDSGVRVLEEKLVAGFNAAVLEAKSAGALVDWLRDHGYAFSNEVEAWAKPYVAAGWKITALKVAKKDDERQAKTVAASALRMSFKTDRPLFPYREPDSRSAADALSAHRRLLRIYFIGDGRYQGELTKETPWTGKVAWSNKLGAADRRTALAKLNLPESTGPAEWWMTEFEDRWPYQIAPADVYFAKDDNQQIVKRRPIVDNVVIPVPLELVASVIAAAVVVPMLLWRWRRTQRAPAEPSN